MAGRIVGIGYAIIFSTPLIVSIIYLFNFLISKNKRMIFVIRLILFIPLTAIALFLIFIIIVKFVFLDIQLSYSINTLGIVLFLIYFGNFFMLMFAIGFLGHGGVSPKDVILNIYRILTKK